jgi:type IV pilus assembly protein PilM
MPIIGLDLGRNTIRAIELDKKKDQLIVNKFHSYENPKLNLDSDAKDDIDLYANSLRDFIQDASFTTPNSVVGLDETYVYMRIVKLPPMSDKELKSSINFEAEQYIPLPLNEVNLTYQKLDVDYSDKGKINIQLVAARKNVLDKYVQILKRAHLVPIAIEPETIALGRALGDTVESPAGSIIVDMGYSRSIIIITFGGFVRFTRSVQIGGDVVTKSIQQTLGLDYNQADEYKKVYGLDVSQVDGKIYGIIKPLMDTLVDEIKRASIFFTKQYPNANIKRVILTGGSAQMPNLLLFMANSLDLEVEVANPFRFVTTLSKSPQEITKLNEEGPIYSSAFGLALKEV